MRKLAKIALGALAGIAAGASAVKLARDYSEHVNGKYDSQGLPPGFVWVDGMDLDRGDDEPWFEEGDLVYLVSPINGGYWAGNSDMDAPIVFVVEESMYDEEDEDWRYKVRPRDVSEEDCGLSFDLSTEWVAERWMDIADKPSLSRKMPTVTTELKISRQALEGMVADKLSKDYYEIDYWLDTMWWSSDEGERKQAEERLRELTKGDGGE